MPDLRKQEDDRSKQHWAFVEAAASKVESWPLWKQAAVLTAIQTERQKEAEENHSVGHAYAAD
ncbi:MAG TPA: hypothetical protein VH088_03485 [Terriglobales bacterium]|jgi:hypothetical protein|nr:hypothetical protein [Terriglobales bacterium]